MGPSIQVLSFDLANWAEKHIGQIANCAAEHQASQTELFIALARCDNQGPKSQKKRKKKRHALHGRPNKRGARCELSMTSSEPAN